jgi:hypothetical protein
MVNGLSKSTIFLKLFLDFIFRILCKEIFNVKQTTCEELDKFCDPLSEGMNIRYQNSFFSRDNSISRIQIAI